MLEINKNWINDLKFIKNYEILILKGVATKKNLIFD